MTAVKLARRTSKPYQLKAPPRLDSIFPLLLSYTLQIRKSKDETGSAKRLHVDFSHVEEFDVLGVSIFLANLAKEIRSHKRFDAHTHSLSLGK